LEIDQFDHTEFDTIDQMKEVAFELYNVFIKDDSELEINIDEKARKPILDAIEAGDRNCFAAAKTHIIKLMEPIYFKFKNSPTFERMKRDLSGSSQLVATTHLYSRQYQFKAVTLLLEYLDLNFPKNQSISELAQFRHDVIRSLLHAFCITRLGIDFVDVYMTATKEETAHSSEGKSSKHSNTPSQQSRKTEKATRSINPFESFLRG
jgi:hypothetical protein